MFLWDAESGEKIVEMNGKKSYPNNDGQQFFYPNNDAPAIFLPQ